MPSISVKRTVPLTADQAFAIAADVAAYKEFLPLCQRSTIRGAVEKTDVGDKFRADLQIAVEKLGMREAFTSDVTTDKTARTVTATSSDGPMKSLKAVWTITPLGEERAEVGIAIDYVFKSMLLQLAAGGLIDVAVGRVLQAFEERGRKLYPTVIA